MAGKKKTYIAGQSLHNRVEVDDSGNKVITNQVIYETKEFVDGYVDVKLPERHYFRNGGFLTMFQEPLQIIAEHGNLTKAQYQLMLWLIGTAGADGSVVTNLDIIAESISMSKSMVSRALKGLVQRNIIIRSDGTRYDRQPLPMELSFNYDQLNYNLAYNGKTANFRKNKVKHPALSIPGEKDGQWLDTSTGEMTIEMNGMLIQKELPFEDIEEEEHAND